MLEAEDRNMLKSKRRVSSIQSAIPSAKLHDNGIMEFSGKVFSATYAIQDTDFASGSEEEQEKFFRDYEDVLNSLDTAASYKITIVNRNINYKKDYSVYLPENVMDGYDKFRREMNEMRKRAKAKAKGIIQEKYITVTIYKKKAELAEQYFDRFEREFGKKMRQKLHSGIKRIDTNEKIQLLYDMYRCGEEQFFDFDYKKAKERKTTFKDYIAPDFLRYRYFDIDIGKKFARTWFVRDWGTSLKPDTLSNMMELRANMMISVDIVPMTVAETKKLMETAEGNAEGNVGNWSKRSGAAKQAGFAVLPIALKKDRQIVTNFADDVNKRNMKVFMASVSGMVLADSMDELDNYMDTLKETAQEGGCQIQPLAFRQREGFDTVLPFGPRYMLNLRDVTTENLAVMMPFNYVMYNHKTGIPYGIHADNFQEILIDRRLLLNGNEWVLAVSGAGKSFRVKLTAFYELLMTDGDIIFIDPHGEFEAITEAVGGQVIHLGGNSTDVINIMDLARSYEDGNDIRSKLEVLTVVFNGIFGNEYNMYFDSIMKRCGGRLYQEYLNDPFNKPVPTITDLYNLIKIQKEGEARRLALLLEIFLNGSLKCFNGQTNVNLYNRTTCFNLSNLSESLWTSGMTVVIDIIRNKLTHNQNISKPTYIKLDEAARILSNQYLTEQFDKFFSEIRKYGGYMTGIIQNISKIRNNQLARDMLSNSEIVVMLKQSDSDAQDLQEMFGLSRIQVDQLLNADEGCGLIKCGSNIIGFNGKIDQYGEIYDLINTKPKNYLINGR